MKKLFLTLLGTLNGVAGLGTVFLMVAIVADVMGRALFNHAIEGVPEVISLTVVGIVWIQFATALNRQQHLRSDLLFLLFPVTMRRIVHALNCLAGAAIFGLIAWYAQDNTLEALRTGTFEGELPVRIKIWPIWGAITLGAALMVVEYLRQTFAVVQSGDGCPDVIQKDISRDASQSEAA